MAICVSWRHMGPHFGGRGGCRGSAMVPFERAMVVSYKLSIVTIALSVTIQPQFAIECLQRSNQRGVSGSRWAQISGCSPWCLGLQRANRPTLTNREIIFKEFQPMWSQSTNATDGWTERHAIARPRCSASRGKTRKPCCRRESARCRCNFRSIDQDMINKDQWRTYVKLSYVTYLLNL